MMKTDCSISEQGLEDGETGWRKKKKKVGKKVGERNNIRKQFKNPHEGRVLIKEESSRDREKGTDGMERRDKRCMSAREQKDIYAYLNMATDSYLGFFQEGPRGPPETPRHAHQHLWLPTTKERKGGRGRVRQDGKDLHT